MIFLPGGSVFAKTRDAVSNRSIVANFLPPTNVKRMELTNLWKVFANSWVSFIKRPCLNGLYSVSIACLHLERNTYLPHSKKNKSAASVCTVMGMGYLLLYGCL